MATPPAPVGGQDAVADVPALAVKEVVQVDGGSGPARRWSRRPPPPGRWREPARGVGSARDAAHLGSAGERFHSTPGSSPKPKAKPSAAITCRSAPVRRLIVVAERPKPQRGRHIQRLVVDLSLPGQASGGQMWRERAEQQDNRREGTDREARADHRDVRDRQELAARRAGRPRPPGPLTPTTATTSTPSTARACGAKDRISALLDSAPDELPGVLFIQGTTRNQVPLLSSLRPHRAA